MFSLITYDIWISIEESYSQKSQFNELKFNNKQRVEFWIAIISVHCKLLMREANGSFSFSCTFNFCRIKVVGVATYMNMQKRQAYVLKQVGFKLSGSLNMEVRWSIVVCCMYSVLEYEERYFVKNALSWIRVIDSHVKFQVALPLLHRGCRLNLGFSARGK